MSHKVHPIPEGRQGAIPYLCVRGAAGAIEFYKRAFGAKELSRVDDPTGKKIGHAELQIGGAIIMLADEYPEMGFVSPQTLGGTSIMIHLYVEDVDALARQAVAAGAKITRPVEDQFYGDRGGKLEDPYGHAWWVATHKENMSPEEMKNRAAAQFGAA